VLGNRALKYALNAEIGDALVLRVIEAKPGNGADSHRLGVRERILYGWLRACAGRRSAGSDDEHEREDDRG
jgi:hypothetical protein